MTTRDIEKGLRVEGAKIDVNGSDPLAAIRRINSLATSDGTAILVLQNFYRFLQSAEIVQALSQQVIAGKQNRTIVVVLSPVVQLPVELEKLFVVLDHELPDREQLADIAHGIATEESELPEGIELATVLDAAAGLTRLSKERFQFVLGATWSNYSGCCVGTEDSDPSQIRLDGISFLDLPQQEEKDAIWNIYLDLFRIDRQQRMPDDTDWTGAEITHSGRLVLSH